MQDSHDHRPLYIQLVDVLSRNLIADGKPDSQLPTEKELCEEYAVSRTTVRLALSELERRGCIYRIQGRGTFIAPAPRQHPNSLLDFNLSNHCDGIDPKDLKCEIFNETREGVPHSIEQLFCAASASSRIMRLKLVHRIGTTPVAVETLYLKSNGRDVPSALEEPDLEALLSETKKSIARSSEYYQARLLFEGEVPEFCNEPIPALLVSHSGYRADGSLVCVSELKIITNHMHYQNYFTSL